METIPSVISLGLIGGLFAIVAFFLKRLIETNDKFQDETKRNFREVRKGLAVQTEHIQILDSKIAENTRIRKIQVEQEAKISSNIAEISEAQQAHQEEINEQTSEIHGKVVVLETTQEQQDKKILTMYKTIKHLIEKNRLK